MKISELIYKKLNSEISLKEDEKLSQWLNESDENKAIFESLSNIQKEGHDISDIKAIDARKSYKKFKDRLSKRKQVLFQIRPLLPYAAIFIGILSLTLSFYFFNDDSRQPIENYENLITLELESGEIHILDQKSDKKISNSKGEVLASVSNNEINHFTSETTKLIYTTLKIPNGKRFEIVLSDGTRVFLNSGSDLRYPIRFIKGEYRQVHLSGEAFFDVAKDVKHPFKVTTDAMDVEVLGTEFNISSYPEDLQSNAILVEGSVRLSTSKDSELSEKSAIILEPGFRAELIKSDGLTKLTEVDTDIYTSWRDGKLIFKSLSFYEIIKKLERYYGVEIENTFNSLDDEVFSASFNNEPLEEVLTSFSENKKFKFSIKEQKIIISKP